MGTTPGAANPADLTAYIEVPASTKKGFSDRWATTNDLLINLGRFMERTGIEMEIEQVDSAILKCVCADHAAYTALRLAYGPFFTKWPRETDEMVKKAGQRIGSSKSTSSLPSSKPWFDQNPFDFTKDRAKWVRHEVQKRTGGPDDTEQTHRHAELIRRAMLEDAKARMERAQAVRAASSVAGSTKSLDTMAARKKALVARTPSWDDKATLGALLDRAFKKRV